MAISMVSYVGVLAIMLLNVDDVLLTKAVTKPVTGAYEITEYCCCALSWLRLPMDKSKKTHINMTLFVKYLPSGSKFIVYGLMDCCRRLRRERWVMRRSCRRNRQWIKVPSQVFY